MILCPVNLLPRPALDPLAGDINELAILLIPTAIGYVLWKVFATNRMPYRRFPWNWLALYSAITVLTLKLGLIALDNYYILMEELSALLLW